MQENPTHTLTRNEESSGNETDEYSDDNEEEISYSKEFSGSFVKTTYPDSKMHIETKAEEEAIAQSQTITYCKPFVPSDLLSEYKFPSDKCLGALPFTPSVPKFKDVIKSAIPSRISVKKGDIQPRNQDFEYYVSIKEEKSGAIGIAAFHVNSWHILLSEYFDVQNYMYTFSTLTAHEPRCIILPEGLDKSLLHCTLEKNFPQAAIFLMKKNFFDENEGRKLFEANSRGETLLQEARRKLSFAALSAVYTFVAAYRKIGLPGPLLDIRFLSVEDFALIDLHTVAELNLLENIENRSKKGSLYSCFYCCTDGGRRLLRSSIIQPFCSREKIEERLAALDEVIKEGEGYVKDIRSVLAHFRQWETVMVELMLKQHAASPNPSRIRKIFDGFAMLTKILQSVTLISSFLAKFKTPMLKKCYQALSHEALETIKLGIYHYCKETCLTHYYVRD